VTYSVRLAASAVRDLERISPRIVPAIIEFIYGDLASHPYRVGKALRNDLAGYLSARRGPYRILYRVDDETITVDIIRVDHRAAAYRPL
jgi:mRNA-degrading endonuclease RelE of RelBE toxin-antitoxin system